MISKDRQLISQLTNLNLTMQKVLSLESNACDFLVEEYLKLKLLLENYEHLDFTIDFYNSAAETVKNITQLRNIHPDKKHFFTHLNSVVELLKDTVYKHPVFKRNKLINAKVNTKNIVQHHIIHAKKIIEAAEKAHTETNRILHSLQQQCELQNIDPELAARIDKAATKMHLMNIAATIAADKITAINNEL